MTLDPRPIGWFALGFSRDLRPGDRRPGVLATVPYVLRRDEAGRVHFTGGPVQERNGVIYAWNHPGGEEPSFDIPELDFDGWLPLRTTRLEARSHPQETYENSIDTAHFPIIHKYADIEQLQPMRLEGEQMSVRYRISRAALRWRMFADFEVRLHGIGVAHNHISVPGLGLQVRMMALSTPTTEGNVVIHLAVSARGTRWWHALAAPLIAAGVHHGIVHDFRQDMQVWEHKVYLDRPVLVREDGPIGPFRRWARQFYAA